MKVSAVASCTMFEITEVPGLDSIRFIMQDVGPGAGRLWLECYGEAWSAYWGGMGQQKISEFLRTCSGPDYVVNYLLHPVAKRTKTKEAYLTKIVETLLSAIRANFMD